METKNNAPEHPYMKKLQGTLNRHYKRHECLIKRISLIRNNFSTKDEYEKNEIELTIQKTESEIDSLKKVIEMRETYFRKFMEQFVLDCEDMEKNYDSVLEKAKAKQDKIKDMKEVLGAVQWEVLDENIEAKIKIFQRLKKMVA